MTAHSLSRSYGVGWAGPDMDINKIKILGTACLVPTGSLWFSKRFVGPVTLQGAHSTLSGVMQLLQVRSTASLIFISNKG